MNCSDILLGSFRSKKGNFNLVCNECCEIECIILVLYCIFINYLK